MESNIDRECVLVFNVPQSDGSSVPRFCFVIPEIGHPQQCLQWPRWSCQTHFVDQSLQQKFPRNLLEMLIKINNFLSLQHFMNHLSQREFQNWRKNVVDSSFTCKYFWKLQPDYYKQNFSYYLPAFINLADVKYSPICRSQETRLRILLGQWLFCQYR